MLKDSLQFSIKFHFTLLKEGPYSAIQNNDIKNSHVSVTNLF